jgi:hypothetical protein
MLRARTTVLICAGLAVVGFGALDWADSKNRPREAVDRTPVRAEPVPWELRWNVAAPQETAVPTASQTSPELPCNPSTTARTGPETAIEENAAPVDPYAG